ncbi:hypothetical protein N3K66_001619 [Trichothecium roseum]|uniref:Uncharacterized protein n=1 Tax=Trichothecium roseum TaxID=47278 RepID=A0ACC0VH99_9HYPO|nr:hypothetical protein N3K66_001619 [Trichothecium roseum]
MPPTRKFSAAGRANSKRGSLQGTTTPSVVSPTSTRATERAPSSYDGSDADYYYELKEEAREERKQEPLGLKEQDEKAKQVARGIELEMEDKVREVRERLEKQMATGKGDEPPSVGNPGQSIHFQLFSVEHVDYFYNDFYASKYVELYSQAVFDGDQEYDEEAKPGENDELGGHVYFKSSAGCDLTSFFASQNRQAWRNFVSASAAENTTAIMWHFSFSVTAT